MPKITSLCQLHTQVHCLLYSLSRLVVSSKGCSSFKLKMHAGWTEERHWHTLDNLYQMNSRWPSSPEIHQ